MPDYKNYAEKRQKLESGELSLVDNVSYFLDKIEENKKLNAFNFVFREEALSKALSVTEKFRSGKPGKLAGIVIAIKDVLAIKHKPLTCSSKILENFISLYDAAVIKKLEAEDAILIGKTSCDEFAMGSSNENSAFGPVLNPVDLTRVPGGSSGGSAVAVASGCCDAALGTDTGGSIRQPAAFCGIYGLKPTYGRVSRFGLTAFASSFDSIGPFANNTEDASLILEVIAGKDDNDSTSADFPEEDYCSQLNDININSKDYSGKPRIGLPAEFFGQGLNPEIKASIELIVSKLKENDFEVSEITLPRTEYSIATYYILTTAEASSNLARFDGARYGYRNPDSRTLHQMYTMSRSHGFGMEVKRRIMLGTYVLSAGYYEAYYKKAQKVRRLLKEDFDKAFSKVDVILTPTTPSVAFKIGEKSSDPLEMYLNDIYTTSANLAGIPGISIPVGKNSEGLPIGLQLMADQFNETALLKLSYFIQNSLLK